ncbi:probable phytol kinase 2, chloroplastic [Nymphaea colorata]|nr:probable phytol kinase 2, chloroplastic [Nymphaea colorata]
MWFRVVRAMSKALAATPLAVLLLPRPKLFRRRSRLPLDDHLRRKEKEEPSFVLRRRIGGGPDPWSSTVGGRGANSVTPRVSMPSILPPADGLNYDIAVAAFTAGVALALLRFWDEIAKRGVFDQKTNRKLVHITVGLVFMLFWPLFSDASWASFFAALAPGINVVRMILMGKGILKNDAMVKSISRHGDYRELLKGPLYYACTITIATAFFWRTSPIAIAAICNLCAGDGIADIVGRRFGTVKLPYNKMKSFAGTMSMAIAGFITSVVYLYYYSMFGLCDYSWRTIAGFLVVSLSASVVESLPISTELDDNLTVPLTSMLVGGLIF